MHSSLQGHKSAIIRKVKDDKSGLGRCGLCARRKPLEKGSGFEVLCGIGMRYLSGTFLKFDNSKKIEMLGLSRFNKLIILHCFLVLSCCFL